MQDILDMRIKRVPIFKIRVVYKNGYVHDFEAKLFEYINNGYRWIATDPNNRPIDMGTTEIAAVWQIGFRKKWIIE